MLKLGLVPAAAGAVAMESLLHLLDNHCVGVGDPVRTLAEAQTELAAKAKNGR
jgi:hypothetical protein